MQRTNKRTGIRAIAAVLMLSLFAAVNAVCVIAAPAVQSITVTDGGTTIYADKGQTFISNQTDVFVTAESGVDYYILKTGYVDIYYNGADNFPVGSHFIPPFVKGAWVKTIGVMNFKLPENKITNANGWKITIPALAPGEIYNLRIAAVKDGAESVIYGHQFFGSGCLFTSTVKEGKLVSTVTNNTANEVNGMFFFAIYKNGKLVYIDQGAFGAKAGESKSFDFIINFANYPVGEHTFKAFCFDMDYVPLAPDVTLNP